MKPDDELDDDSEPGEPFHRSPPVASISWPVGPEWWDGRWPDGGITSLADLERWVNARLEEMISLRRAEPDMLEDLALGVGRQAVENVTRYLARFGTGDHPRRPKPDELAGFGDIQNALEALLRHIKQANANSPEIAPEPPVREDSPAVGSVSDAGQTTKGPSLPADVNDPSVFVIDETTFTVRWQGNVCEFDNTIPFRVLVRLANRPGQPVRIGSLINDVWGTNTPEKNTVQKTVCGLRKQLSEAGIDNVIVTKTGAYTLSPPDGTVRVLRDPA